MKKKFFAAAAVIAAMPFGLAAQSAVDAYNITPAELRGTARFVSMGGAFTSLGGDLSTLTQNPAGIGVYRRSEVGLTFDISIRKFSTHTSPATFENGQAFNGSIKSDKTKADFDNFGYIGTTQLNGMLRNFNWGLSYNRLNSFYREYTGYNASTTSSLSNYIAGFSGGYPATGQGGLDFITDSNGADVYNPYSDSGNDWLSILAYTGGLINLRPGTTDQYQGLFNGSTVGDAAYRVREQGYVDEYNIDFGGNVSDILYWGIGVGINDLSYRRDVMYSESMADAAIESGGKIVNGDAGFDLSNTKLITGTGANIKLGVIIRPADIFRIGFAVHTPTWYHLRSQGDADVSASYYNPSLPESQTNPNQPYTYTDMFDYNWRLNSPWRFMVGASLVLGSNAIVSLDYERVAFNDMTVKYQTWDSYNGGDFVSDDNVNSDIKNYYQGANIVRLGLEYRLTPQFSVRAGYNFQTSNVRNAAYDGNEEIFTSGTDPSFSFNNTTQNVCFGIGYRYKSWYIDAAYQYAHRTGKFMAYTNYDGVTAPSAKLTDNRHNIVISTGFKF